MLFAAAVVVVIALAVALLALGVDRQFDGAIDAGLSARSTTVATALARGDEEVAQADELTEVVGGDDRVVAGSRQLAVLRGSSHGTSSLLDAAQLRLARRASASRPLQIDVRLPEQRSLSTFPGLDGWLRVQARPVRLPSGRGVLVVGAPLHQVYEAEGNLLLLFVAGASPLAVLLGVAGWLLARAALRPVRTMTERAARISAADPTTRLPQPEGHDEIAELARTLNGMLARVSAGVVREREFVDDAAHELRTPVAVLRGELELALRAGARSGGLPADVEESLRSALAETERLGRLAEDLLVLATAERAAPGSGTTTGTDLLALVRAEVERLAPVAGLDVDVEGEAVRTGVGQRDAGRLLANLLANASSAGASRALVTVVGGHGPLDRDGGPTAARDGEDALAPSVAVLRVDDDGPGLPHSLLATATERFTRGDRARTRGASGAGLGLAIVDAVVVAHGGRLSLSNDSPLGGASVRVRLPALEPAEVLDALVP